MTYGDIQTAIETAANILALEKKDPGVAYLHPKTLRTFVKEITKASRPSVGADALPFPSATTATTMTPVGPIELRVDLSLDQNVVTVVSHDGAFSKQADILPDLPDVPEAPVGMVPPEPKRVVQGPPVPPKRKPKFAITKE